MEVFIIGALPSSLINFRGSLIKKIAKNGIHVTTMASGASPSDSEKINRLGAVYKDYPVERNGLNPIKDIITFIKLYSVLSKKKPNILICYTVKPAIWGGLASRCNKVTNFYAMITGLGYAFQRGGVTKTFLNILVKVLYRIALKNSKGVIFQNQDNMRVFIEQGIVSRGKCFLVNGSGVNLLHFQKEPLPEKPRFLLIARLLGDKGIREYVQAAEMVLKKYPEASFELLGPEDSSPDGIQIEEINQYCERGTIKYCGAAVDVRPYIKKCSIYVLPSYHEGMPRTVLEAMAMGRPILTTNVPGCKETVVNGENGWLVEKANVKQLAERMGWFIENPDQWGLMGSNSHAIAKDKFDVDKVDAAILKIIGLSNEKTV